MNIKSIGYRIKHFFMHNLVHRNMAILKKGLFEKKNHLFFCQIIKIQHKRTLFKSPQKKNYGHYRPYNLVSHGVLICYFVRKNTNNTSS
jgi:hypothetical protein